MRLVRSWSVEQSKVPLQAMLFSDDANGSEHLAFVWGDLSKLPASYAPLTRIHSECLTGDLFGSRRCDCGPQLLQAIDVIENEGAGIILYLRQEGRGIGLENKLKAYTLQDSGLDTVDANLKLGFAADQRDFAVAAHILLALKIPRIRILTNNPKKLEGLEARGVEIVERVPIKAPADPLSEAYLMAKRDRLGHML